MPLVLPPGKGLEVWQLELAETMGRHVGAALASAERRDEHRRLGVLEERAAIARELHDSLAQSLSYTKIQIARLAAQSSARTALRSRPPCSGSCAKASTARTANCVNC